MPNTHKHLEWTLERAAYEFGCDRKTLSKRVTALGLEPCYKKRFYSTAQMAAAVFGDLEAERTRETRESADKLALANAKTRKEIVPSADISPVFEEAFIPVRQAIKASSMSDLEKTECLRHLKTINVDDILKTALRELEEDTSPGV